jgi:hypothetical protein
MRLNHAIFVLGGVILAASITAAQAPAGGQAPAGAPAPAGGGQRGAPVPEPHNLKVLPASTTTAQILPIMRTFSAALGTNCGYCHVWTAAGDPSNDYAADTKPTKLVARVMMQMAGEINQKLAANIKKPADQLTTVGCMTCHRGEAIPKVPPPAPAPARGAAPGAAAPGGAAPPPATQPPPGR